MSCFGFFLREEKNIRANLEFMLTVDTQNCIISTLVSMVLLLPSALESEDGAGVHKQINDKG